VFEQRGIRDVLEAASASLTAAGIADAEVDAELLLAHVLGEPRGRVQALAVLGRELDVAQVERLDLLVSERARRVPLQHLTGRAPFRSIELSVGPGVFVPRPETEIVSQFAIDALLSVPGPQPLAVDLCTGSGAIALALAHEVPHAKVFAVEKSPEAHAWAQRNTEEWGDGRVELLLGDVAELDPSQRSASTPLVRAFAGLRGRVDVLAANPPYVPDAMVPRDPEVRDHDPALALYGGADGLDLVRVISRVGCDLVAPGGTIVIEHAEQQGRAIRELLSADGWLATATHPDLTGRDRATTAIAPGESATNGSELYSAAEPVDE